MLKKLKWQIPGEPLVALYNWCRGPVPGRGPAVEKHWLTQTNHIRWCTNTIRSPASSWLLPRICNKKKYKIPTRQLICQSLLFPTHTKLQVLVRDKTFRGNLRLNYSFDSYELVEQITGVSWMVLHYTDQHHHQSSSKRAQLHNTPVWFTFNDKTLHSMALGLTTF